MKNLKQIPNFLYLSLVVFTLAFTVASCDDDDNEKPKNVLKFSPDKLEVTVAGNGTTTVSGGVAPYIVASSDVKIATVKVENSTITVSGIKNGSATIMVTDKNKNTGKFSVTVKDAPTGLEFDKKDINVGIGKEDVATVKGGTAPYTAESKDDKIATVSVKDDKVTIKGVKAGSTTITVIDKAKKSGTISVTVK